ncbi:MAG: glycoside hydrolase family 16 protein [Bacillota bacterium]|nr:glycoside hydrolase family 16 protein [Bacillota bacterium]
MFVFIFSLFTINLQAASTFTDNFNGINGGFWQKADGYSNGSMFNCTWRGANITNSNGVTTLKLNKDSGSKPYSGAELRTINKYGYGYYEVKMKPAKNPGIVSSFFTYTGPSDGTPWDEIDIEFLGKDTTKVQFNYYTKGVGNHEKLYSLGFDASTSFHTYGFEWKSGSISWYVDGRAVYTATKSIPTNPGKIMINLWPGIGVDSWLNRYDGRTPLYAQYDYIKKAW